MHPRSRFSLAEHLERLSKDGDPLRVLVGTVEFERFRPLLVKGEPGTGNVAEAVTHIRMVNNEIRRIRSHYQDNDRQELMKAARELKVSYAIVEETARLARLPVVNFAAGGITTPADAAFLMNLGCDGVFVGSGIFKSEDPAQRARAVVLATTFYDDAKIVREAQKMVDEKKSLLGLDTKNLELRMQERGQSA